MKVLIKFYKARFLQQKFLPGIIMNDEMLSQVQNWGTRREKEETHRED